MRAQIGILASLLTFPAACAFGQAGGLQSESTGWPRVTVNVLIERTPGDATLTTPSDLQVEEDGRSEAVSAIAGPGTPVSLCIELDVSASMERVKTETRDSAYLLAKGLPQGSEVMVIAFATKPVLVLPFTPVSSIEPQSFENLQFGHRTALYDAMVMAESSFQQSARFARRALVIFTDGDENASRSSAGDTRHAVLNPQAPFVYVLEIQNPYAAREPGAHDLLRTIHARIIPVTPIKEILRFVAGVSKCISGQYALNYGQGSVARDNRFHKFEVKLPETHKGLRIEYMAGYYIPSA